MIQPTTTRVSRDEIHDNGDHPTAYDQSSVLTLRPHHAGMHGSAPPPRLGLTRSWAITEWFFHIRHSAGLALLDDAWTNPCTAHPILPGRDSSFLLTGSKTIMDVMAWSMRLTG